MEFTVTSTMIVSVAGLITACGVIYGAFKKIMEEAKKPDQNTIDKLNSHEEKLSRDKKEIDNIKEEQTIMLQSQLVMIQHMIDGNGIDGLKEQRDKIQDYLIKR